MVMGFGGWDDTNFDDDEEDYPTATKKGLEDGSQVDCEKVDKALLRLLKLLDKNGFKPKSTHVKPFRKYVDRNICEWFSKKIVQSKLDKTDELIRPSETEKILLTRISLDFALILFDEGVVEKNKDDLHYNESLNGVAMTVCEILRERGYNFHYFHDSHIPWLGFKKWEEVARIDGMSEKDIKENRNYIKNDMTGKDIHKYKFYEE